MDPFEPLGLVREVSARQFLDGYVMAAGYRATRYAGCLNSVRESRSVI
jgi:hypothetical protein